MIKIPEITSINVLNIFIHIVILFTVLSLFFMIFTSKIEAEHIDAEIGLLIDKAVHDSVFSIDNINSKIHRYEQLQNKLIENFDNNTNNNNAMSKEVEKITVIINNLKLIASSIVNGDVYATEEITKIVNFTQENFSYDYYEKLFSSEDYTRKKINNLLFDNIKIVNTLLIFILILFVLYLFNTKQIDINDFKLVVIENIITFMFIGLIEVFFFFNIILKYIPAPPSLLSSSFLNNLLLSSS
jgi:hypothetical protein